MISLFANHDFDDFFVGGLHALLAQSANVGDGSFGRFTHQAILRLEIHAPQVHVVAQDASLNRRGEFGCAG